MFTTQRVYTVYDSGCVRASVAVSAAVSGSVSVAAVCLCVSVAVVSGVEWPKAQKTAVCRAVCGWNGHSC